MTMQAALTRLAAQRLREQLRPRVLPALRPGHAVAVEIRSSARPTDADVT